MTANPDDFVIVYITVPSMDIARDVAQKMIEERLAACANMYPVMLAMYQWEDKIEEAQEVAVLLKTTKDLFGRIEVRVRSMHPHKCPCIVAVPLAHGEPSFLDWIQASTRNN